MATLPFLLLGFVRHYHFHLINRCAIRLYPGRQFNLNSCFLQFCHNFPLLSIQFLLNWGYSLQENLLYTNLQSSSQNLISRLCSVLHMHRVYCMRKVPIACANPWRIYCIRNFVYHINISRLLHLLNVSKHNWWRVLQKFRFHIVHA